MCRPLIASVPITEAMRDRIWTFAKEREMKWGEAAALLLERGVEEIDDIDFYHRGAR